MKWNQDEIVIDGITYPAVDFDLTIIEDEVNFVKNNKVDFTDKQKEMMLLDSTNLLTLTKDDELHAVMLTPRSDKDGVQKVYIKSPQITRAIQSLIVNIYTS